MSERLGMLWIILQLHIVLGHTMYQNFAEDGGLLGGNIVSNPAMRNDASSMLFDKFAEALFTPTITQDSMNRLEAVDPNKANLTASNEANTSKLNEEAEKAKLKAASSDEEAFDEDAQKNVNLVAPATEKAATNSESDEE